MKYYLCHDQNKIVCGVGTSLRQEIAALKEDILDRLQNKQDFSFRNTRFS